MNYYFIIVDGYIIGSLGLPATKNMQFAIESLMTTENGEPEPELDEEHENWSYFSMNDVNMRLIFNDNGDAADTLENAGDLSALFGGSGER